MKTTIKLFLSELTAHAGCCLLICFFLFSGTASAQNLTVDNGVLKWSDGSICKIVEANSPETPFHFNDYAWMNWLRSKGVNTLYCTTNGTDGGITTTPYINNNQNSGFDNAKVDQWVAMSNYWVNTLWNGKGIMHILLSEKETHDKYTAATQKQIMLFLVQKFSPVAGNIIWDREEYPNGRTSQINDLYGYLKSIDPNNLRGMHNNTAQNPWSGHYNSDLIQFLSFQESTNSFDNRIRSEVLKFTQQKTTGYASEMTGGFQTNDVAKAETIFNAAQPYNAGAGVYISCCDQRNTSNNWYRAYEPVYTRLAQLAGNSVNAIPGCTDPNATNYNPNATVDDGSCQTCNGTLDCNNVCNGTAQIDSCGICAGGNTGITPCASSSNAIRFRLVNASNNAILFEITDNMTFSNSTGINVVVDGPGVQAPVRMFYDAIQASYESTAPFSVFGDNNGNYNPVSFTPGSHSIRAEIEGTSRERTVYFTVGTTTDPCSRINCDDGDPCTIDGCIDGICTQQPDPGCNEACAQPEVVSFTLVRASNGTAINPLINGTVIDKSSIGSFSIRANACGEPIGSVSFTLNGNTIQTENYAPYSINGDYSNGTIYTAWNPSPGNYTLTGTAYSATNGNGTTGVSLTVTFIVVASGCTDRLQCNDNNTCTVDDCINGRCNNTPVNCNDNNSCTIDACDNGTCTNQPDPGCNGDCTQQEVVSFTLVRASNGIAISQLINGMVIDKSSIGSFSVRADVCDQPVGSVSFTLNGSDIQTENYAPYSINGDYSNGTTYTPWNPNPGYYTLKGTPYSAFNGNGTEGVSETVSFTITNSAAKMDGSEIIEDEVALPENLLGDLKVYPNPFTDELIIDFSSENEGTATLRILNSLGQAVATETIKFQNGENKHILFLDKTLPGGIYLLQLDYGILTEYRKIFKLGLQ